MIAQVWLTGCNLVNCRLNSTTSNKPKGWIERYESFLSRRFPKVYAVQSMVMNGMDFNLLSILLFYL